MDELNIGAEQPGPLQLHDRAGTGCVHGDRQAEGTGAIPVALDLLDRQDAAGGRGRRAADCERAKIARGDAQRE
jgi:hypothetical protein